MAMLMDYYAIDDDKDAAADGCWKLVKTLTPFQHLGMLKLIIEL